MTANELSVKTAQSGGLSKHSINSRKLQGMSRKHDTETKIIKLTLPNIATTAFMSQYKYTHISMQRQQTACKTPLSSHRTRHVFHMICRQRLKSTNRMAWLVTDI